MKQRNGTRKVSIRSILLLIYIILLVVMFFCTQTYFGTSDYNLIFKISVVVIGLFSVAMIAYNRGVIPYNREDNFVYSLFLFPYLYLDLVSLIEGLLAGDFQFHIFMVYSIRPTLICLMAILCYSIFKERVVKATIIASVINYSVYIVTCVAKFGLLSLLDAGSDNAASRLLEVHEITFVFGLLFLYFWMTKKEEYKKLERRKKRLILLMLIMSLLGFKRILCAALILLVAIYWIMAKFREKGIEIISCLVVFACFGWCAFCSAPSLLKDVCAALGVNLKGRDVIYASYLPYYNFSWSYIGRGVGFAQSLVYQIKIMYLNGIYLGVHNEILRLFIDIGFFPYLIYLLYILPINITKIKNRINSKAALLYFCLWLFTLVNSSTDNLLTYPNYMLVFTVIGIHSLIEERQKM